MTGSQVRFAAGIVLSAGMFAVAGTLPAQDKSSLSDAEIEANVLKALSAAPELATQNIQTTTTFGTVTISGNVHDEATRTKTENLVARAPGVKKVVDELTLGDEPAQTAQGADPNSPEMANIAGGACPNGAPVGPDGACGNAQQQAGPDQEYAQGNQPAPPNGQPGYAEPNQDGYPPQPGYGQQPPPNYGGQAGQQPGYGQPNYGPQSAPPPPDYSGQPAPPPGYGAEPAPSGRRPMYPPQYAYGPGAGQPAGVAVMVPAGAPLQIRINRGLDSQHIQPGTQFDGTILQDIVSNGYVAVPRGASVQGVVVDAQKTKELSGRGELALQITSVSFGGQVYPVQSDVWYRHGSDKTAHTVNNAVGLGVVGAIIGGVAGGGAGAAIGAGVGAGAGVAASAGSPRGQVIVPPEAVLNFRVQSPFEVRTVSEQEMARLAYNAGPGRPAPRYYRPRPYPYYPYGGVYYYGR